jgi:hypothetical protein
LVADAIILGSNLETAASYGELKQDFGPDTPKEAVWRPATEKALHNYMALRPDSFCAWSVKNRMEELSQ